MKIIVISSSKTFENEIVQVTKMFEAGLGTFHLRKPRFTTREMKQYLREIPKYFHNRIVIHSHHNLGLKFDLKGIHLTKTHRTQKLKTWFTLRLLKMRNPNLTITTSHKKLVSLFEEENIFDYVFLSPIFDSLTSKYQSGFTDYSLRSAIEKTKFRVIARGGVDIHCIEKVNDIGFAGMALYSGIWKKKDPVAEFNSIVEKIVSLGFKIE